MKNTKTDPAKSVKAFDEDTSDGYHTFRELYRYRMLYNAAFFNMLARHTDIPVVKSRMHGDGELCFGGGWFIVMAQLPTGQVSNHYEDRYWGLFDVPEAEMAPEWDGHTPNDAADRLESFLEMSEPDSDKSNPPGNAAALRGALRELTEAYCPPAESNCEKCALRTAKGGCLHLRARDALSAPSRNCDVGTAEEQAIRFDNDYCFAEVRKQTCIFCKRHDHSDCIKCFAKWAQMPYEEKH